MAIREAQNSQRLAELMSAFMDIEDDAFSQNCLEFVRYQSQPDRSASPNSSLALPPHVQTAVAQLRANQQEIRREVNKFVNDAFLKGVGDYDEFISEADQTFMVRYFQLLTWSVNRRLLMRGLEVGRREFTSYVVWRELMLKPGHKNFVDEESKVRFHTAVLSAFYHLYLGTGVESYSLVRRGAIYSLDPYTRQQQREVNRTKMRRDAAWELFEEVKPLVFLQQLLVNDGLFSDIPSELFGEETPIDWALRIVLRIFEFGFLDCSDCDILISTIDCFASQVQAYFDEIQSNRSVLIGDDNEALNEISMRVVQSQQVLAEVLLHITSVYSDQAFMEAWSGRAASDRLLFFEDSIRFTNVAHVLVKCCTFLWFHEVILNKLIMNNYLMFSNFKQDWVTLLTYLTDPSFDHFVDSWEMLSVVDRRHRPFKISQKELFIRSRLNNEFELLAVESTDEQRKLLQLISEVPPEDLGTERLVQVCESLKSVVAVEAGLPSPSDPSDFLQESIDSVLKGSSKLTLEPQLGMFEKMVSIGLVSRERANRQLEPIRPRLSAAQSHQTAGVRQSLMAEFLSTQTAIDRKVIAWLRVNNVTERVSKLIADCIHLSRESLSDPSSRLKRAISDLTDLLAVLLHQSLFDQAALFSDPFESSVISSEIDGGLHFYSMNYRDVTPTDSLLANPNAKPPKSFPSWGTLCYFQPLAFARMVRLLFTGNFELFLHDKHAFCNLLVYYDLLLRSFYRTLVDQGNYVTAAVGSGAVPNKQLTGDPVFKELNLRLGDYQAALLIWNKLLRQLLKEYVKRNNYSRGYHYFTRVCDLVHSFVQIFVFSEPVAQGTYSEIWGKSEGSVFTGRRGGLANGLFFSNAPAFKELQFSFLKLLNASISGFWKPELMSSIRARFMKKAALVFQSPLADGRSLRERIEYFRLYDVFFNFEKSSLFDEFQLLTGNPDIGLIINKFKPKDFNAIYRPDNIVFLLKEARKLVARLEAAASEPPADQDSALLVKYTWEVFVWAVYKLFKGVTASFYTKIKGINFFAFESSVRSLLDCSRAVVRLSVQFVCRQLRRSGLAESAEELIGLFDLERDAEQLPFCFQTTATGSDPEFTIVKDDQMERIKKHVVRGVNLVFASLGLLCHLHSTASRTTPTDNHLMLRCLDKVIALYHRRMWTLESGQDVVSSGDVVSAAEFNVPTQPARHWSEDQRFAETMESFSRFALQGSRGGQSLRRFVEELRRLLGKKASAGTEATEEKGRKAAVREQRSRAYPEQDRPLVLAYLKTKEKNRTRSAMRDNWRSLFDSRFEEIAASSAGREGSGATERRRTLSRFAEFLIDSCRVNNYYLKDVSWSLSYFDSKITTLNLNFEYFMKNVPEFQDAANAKVNELNDRETNDRNLLNYDQYAPISVTLHENFYELYFNLLNLMYWRLNDAQFMWMYRQFVTLNQLIRTINNVRETATATRDLLDTRVRNPVHQMLVVLRFLTENSRLHLNTRDELAFSDRLDDLPLYSILLSNLSYAVKTYRQAQISYDSSYFKFLNMVLTRKVLSLNSPLYAVQYNGVDAVQSFLLKSSPESLTGLWNSFDFLGLYNHMIWLIKFWFCRARIDRKTAQLNKERQLLRQRARGGAAEESGHPRSDFGNNEPLRVEQAMMFESLMNEEIVGFWDRFTARVGVWRHLSWSSSAKDALFSLLVEAFDRVVLILDIDTYETRSQLVTAAMLRHYQLTFEDEAAPENQSLRSAVQIYVFLKYLGCYVSDVQKFLVERERSAARFVIDADLSHPEDHTPLIAENKALLFLCRIVKRIEINRPTSAEPDAEILLSSVYFRVNPLSLFRTTTIAQDFMEGAPNMAVEARRTFLLEQNEDLILDLQKYRRFYLNFWPFYLAVQPSTIRLLKSAVSVVCVVLNILLVVYVKGPEDPSSSVAYESNGKEVLGGFEIAFIVVSAVYCALVLLQFVKVSVSRVRRSLRQRASVRLNDETGDQSLGFLTLLSTWATAVFDQFWFATCMMVCSVLGRYVNLVFLTLAFLTIVLELRYFRYIAQAVIVDLKRLGLLFFFLVCLLVCVAYITIVYFAHDPSSPAVESDCAHYLGCFFNLFNKGYRAGGGIGEVLTQVTDMATDKFWASFFFTLVYFLLVKQILFNIVFGIIQDNFGDARTSEEEAADRANYCPICDKDIWAIERSGSTFREHVAATHNLWTYQDYLIFLACSSYSSLTDHDIEIKKRNEKFDFSWMPSKDYLTNPYRPKKAAAED